MQSDQAVAAEVELNTGFRQVLQRESALGVGRRRPLIKPAGTAEPSVVRRNRRHDGDPLKRRAVSSTTRPWAVSPGSQRDCDVAIPAARDRRKGRCAVAESDHRQDAVLVGHAGKAKSPLAVGLRFRATRMPHHTPTDGGPRCGPAVRQRHGSRDIAAWLGLPALRPSADRHSPERARGGNRAQAAPSRQPQSGCPSAHRDNRGPRPKRVGRSKTFPSQAYRPSGSQRSQFAVPEKVLPEVLYPTYARVWACRVRR